MASPSNALRLFELLTQAQLKEIAGWRGLHVGGTKDRLAQRIADDCHGALAHIVRAEGPVSRDRWNDAAERLGGRRRRSFDEVVVELERALGGSAPPADEGLGGRTLAEPRPTSDPPSAPLTALIPQPSAGDRIGGRWRVVKRIGRGGMGVAYEVEGRGGTRRVAKLADSTGAHTDALEREATLALELAHENVCRYYELDEDPRFGLFAILQHCGESLAVRYAKQPAPIDVAIQFLTDAAQGIDYLHGTGTIHGDVSPMNLLVDAEDRVRLIDFGIASELETHRHTKGVTRIGTLRGMNRLYASSEVSRGAAPHRASDQQSLAKVLCALLVGVDEYALGPRSSFAELGDRQGVLDQALHEDHKLRFRTCREFVRALMGDSG